MKKLKTCEDCGSQMTFKRSRPDAELGITENVYICKNCGGKLETLETKTHFTSANTEAERRQQVLSLIHQLSPESIGIIRATINNI